MTYLHAGVRGQLLRMCNNGIGRVPGNYPRVQESTWCTNHSWNSWKQPTNCVAVSWLYSNEISISAKENSSTRPLLAFKKIDLVANFCLISFKLSSATVSYIVRLHYLHNLINFTTLVFVWKMMMTTELWILNCERTCMFSGERVRNKSTEELGPWLNFESAYCHLQ